MSSTRHARPDAPLKPWKFASSAEYAEGRGLGGNLVSLKAHSLANPRARSLLYFLQAMSLKEGGLERFTEEFLAAYPERIGTPTMRELCIKKGEFYSPKASKTISFERNFDSGRHPMLLEVETLDLRRTEDRWEDPPQQRLSFEEALSDCRSRCRTEIPKLLTRLCTDPETEVLLDGEESRYWGDGHQIQLPCFDNLLGALLEFQRRYSDSVERAFVKTDVGDRTWQTLDDNLKLGRLMVIEGESRIGKTKAAEAWCEAHLGEARFVTLSGLCNKTSLFRNLSRALGLASGYSVTTTQMQGRIEDMLSRSLLMLVIDEAHYLLPQYNRSRPELIDWLNTALFNQGVPAVLVTTPQFASGLANVERRTSWNADQFKGRVKRYVRLPAVPSKEDLSAVARRLLPDADALSVKLLVGYALTSQRYFPALVDAVDEARLIAERAGRTSVAFDDLRAAIEDYRIPSEQAQARAFAPAQPRKQRRTTADVPPVSVESAAPVRPVREQQAALVTHGSVAPAAELAPTG